MMKYSIFSLFLSKPSSQRARLSRKPRCRCTQTVTKPTRDPTNLWLTYLFAARRTFVFRVRYAALRRDPVRHPGSGPANRHLSEAVKRRLAAGPPPRGAILLPYSIRVRIRQTSILEGRLLSFQSNSTATTAARKSLETISGMILNRLQPQSATKSVANEEPCLKATSRRLLPSPPQRPPPLARSLARSLALALALALSLPLPLSPPGSLPTWSAAGRPADVSCRIAGRPDLNRPAWAGGRA